MRLETLPTNYTQEKWDQSIKLLLGNQQVTHPTEGNCTALLSAVTTTKISEQAALWLQLRQFFPCTDILYTRTDGESTSNEKHCLLSFLETNAKGYSEEKSN